MHAPSTSFNLCADIVAQMMAVCTYDMPTPDGCVNRAMMQYSRFQGLNTDASVVASAGVLSSAMLDGGSTFRSNSPYSSSN